MSEKKQYFKIGIFILSGCFLLIAGIVILAAGQFFEKELIFETYFDGTVQGLDVGSPVKYRGVTIGEVKDISVVNAEYHFKDTDPENYYKYGFYVLVRVAIPQDRFMMFAGDSLAEELDMLIKEKGLRLQLAYLGITGLAYLELDMVDPDKNETLPIVWQPKYFYIPSVQNTIQLVTDSLNDISKALTKDFIPLLENLNSASTSLPDLSVNLNKTLVSLQETLDKVSSATSSVPGLAQKLDETLYHVNQTFKGEKYNIVEVLNNVRVITEDIKLITAELKENPSQVLFGGAPPKKGIARR